MNTTEQEITVIILSFNTKKLTLRAIHSVLKNPYSVTRIFVVDNASTDGTAQALIVLSRKEKRVRLFLRDVNDGFAAGNNAALREATTPYAMLLNSDAHIDAATSLGILASYMEEHPDVGLLTPHLMLGNGHLDLASHRGFPTPWNAFTYFSSLEKISRHSELFGGYHQTWKDIREVHEIDACSGAAMLIRTRAMKEVGLLDEQFFMYGEDIDWCFRFKEKGWKVVFHPGVIVHHDKHTSGIKKTKHAGHTHETHAIQEKSRDAFYEAMKLFYKKHYVSTYPRFLQWLTFGGINIVRKLKGH